MKSQKSTCPLKLWLRGVRTSQAHFRSDRGNPLGRNSPWALQIPKWPPCPNAAISHNIRFPILVKGISRPPSNRCRRQCEGERMQMYDKECCVEKYLRVASQGQEDVWGFFRRNPGDFWSVITFRDPKRSLKCEKSGNGTMKPKSWPPVPFYCSEWQSDPFWKLPFQPWCPTKQPLVPPLVRTMAWVRWDRKGKNEQ